MSKQEEVTLETDHLEEVIETPPPGQPVVVIQYRTRGLPWYVILPSFAIVALVAAAGSYSYVASLARPYPFSGPPGGPMVQTAPSVAAGPADPAQASILPSLEVPAADRSAEPLSLNTQPVGPSPTPRAKPVVEVAKTAEPAPDSQKAQPPRLTSNPPSSATQPPPKPKADVTPVATVASIDTRPSTPTARHRPSPETRRQETDHCRLLDPRQRREPF